MHSQLKNLKLFLIFWGVVTGCGYLWTDLFRLNIFARAFYTNRGGVSPIDGRWQGGLSLWVRPQAKCKYATALETGEICLSHKKLIRWPLTASSYSPSTRWPCLVSDRNDAPSGFWQRSGSLALLLCVGGGWGREEWPLNQNSCHSSSLQNYWSFFFLDGPVLFPSFFKHFLTPVFAPIGF